MQINQHSSSSTVYLYLKWKWNQTTASYLFQTIETTKYQSSFSKHVRLHGRQLQMRYHLKWSRQRLGKRSLESNDVITLNNDVAFGRVLCTETTREIHMWLSFAREGYFCTWANVYMHSSPPLSKKKSNQNHLCTTCKMRPTHKWNLTFLYVRGSTPPRVTEIPHISEICTWGVFLYIKGSRVLIHTKTPTTSRSPHPLDPQSP